MNRPAEFGNPFVEEQPDLNASDVDFIGDVLGLEAQQLFSALQSNGPESKNQAMLSENFTLLNKERADIEKQLPVGFWRKVDEFVEAWGQGRDMVEEERDEYYAEHYAGFFASRELKLSSEQMQTLCDHILVFSQRISATRNLNPGLIFSEILNRSTMALSTDEQETIHLTLGENGSLDGLGDRWSHGTLEITAPAGQFLAWHMTGGRIICAQTGSCAGSDMTGGHLELGETGDSCGVDMSGGMITVGEAGHHVGRKMSGGEIRAKSVKSRCGDSMTGGLITVDRATYSLGANMTGGTIVVGEGGREIGEHMDDGGTIRILHSFESCHRNHYGRIIRPDGTKVPLGETR